MDTSHQILELELIRRYDRPHFEYEGILFLLDSGANMPVWCSGKELFIDTYPTAKETELTAHIKGFGEGCTEASVFNIPEFSLVNCNTSFKINNLRIAVTDIDRIGCDFLMSNTMFKRVDYSVKTSTDTVVITLYNGNIFNCTPITEQDICKKITVWTQQE